MKESKRQEIKQSKKNKFYIRPKLIVYHLNKLEEEIIKASDCCSAGNNFNLSLWRKINNTQKQKVNLKI